MIYEGNFNQDKKHGEGVIIENDKVYKGQFREDVKEGHGELIQLDMENPNEERRVKIKYIGEFKENRIEGTGVIYYFYGDYIQVIEGVFKNDSIEKESNSFKMEHKEYKEEQNKSQSNRFKYQ